MTKVSSNNRFGRDSGWRDEDGKADGVAFLLMVPLKASGGMSRTKARIIDRREKETVSAADMAGLVKIGRAGPIDWLRVPT
ncbi:MAG: hypothetical protein AB1440_10000 [Pseudomonadota bacterium]